MAGARGQQRDVPGVNVDLLAVLAAQNQGGAPASETQNLSLARYAGAVPDPDPADDRPIPTALRMALKRLRSMLLLQHA